LKKKMIGWSTVTKQPLIRVLFTIFEKFSPIAETIAHIRKKHAPVWLNKDFANHYSGTLQSPSNYMPLSRLLPSQQALEHSLSILRGQITCSSSPLVRCHECRYPYLDRDLIAFLYSIPREQLVRPGQRRSLMRRALTHVVPDEIINRSRKAYASRRYLTMISDEWPFLRALFDSSTDELRRYIDRDELLTSLRLAVHGKVVNIIGLLRAMKLELWFRSLDQRHILVHGVTETVHNARRQAPLADMIK
jgi:asparagine synthase (glutamine-hydrolysing)